MEEKMSASTLAKNVNGHYEFFIKGLVGMTGQMESESLGQNVSNTARGMLRTQAYEKQLLKGGQIYQLVIVPKREGLQTINQMYDYGAQYGYKAVRAGALGRLLYVSGMAEILDELDIRILQGMHTPIPYNKEELVLCINNDVDEMWHDPQHMTLRLQANFGNPSYKLIDDDIACFFLY